MNWSDRLNDALSWLFVTAGAIAAKTMNTWDKIREALRW